MRQPLVQHLAGLVSVVGAGGEATALGFSFPAPLPLPLLFSVKHLYGRSSLTQRACADRCIWLPKGSPGHPKGLGPVSAGGETTLGDRMGHPSKEEENCQSACGGESRMVW